VNQKIPKIKSVQFKEFKTEKTPESIYANFVDTPYTALLCGKGEKDNSRYAFIGINPFYKMQTNKEPFNEFQNLLNHFSVKEYKYPMNLWGGIGYLSYSAAHHTEKLPNTTKDDLKMPDMQMVFYKDLLVFDLHNNQNYLIQVQLENDDYTDHDEIFKRVDSDSPNRTFFVEKPVVCCDKETYMKKIDKIRNYIVQGDVYEVNLAHRCRVPYKGDLYAVFQKLFKMNPSPFSAYLPFGDHTIICNSPERFLLAEESHVETRPMKGTAPRGKTSEEDQQNKKALLSSVKDEAELSMIVDLLRNDLGKVSEYGSVHVREHKRLEQYLNVWHLISIIEGDLRKDETYGSLLRATFPGGSITGCPKIRSMEIIDELEDYSRNLYTGTIFIANDVRMDSNIVIRTAIAHKGNLDFYIGGAIVYDSDAENEYEETLHKAKSILQAIGASF
jgi:para-aminobenzoate synthetase component 1